MKPDQAQLLGQDEGGFCLVTEQATDFDAIQRETEAREKREAEAQSRQGDLFEQAGSPARHKAR